jgi:alpha-L-fucosidase
LAGQFNPVKFDADEWAELAQAAGMKYMVITSKHHDGFCMFDSMSNPYNIVAQTPLGRDVMKELAAACNKRGIKLCFYYSQAQDWHAEGGAGHWDEVGDEKSNGWLAYARPPEDFQKYLDDVVKPNLRELLTNYGPIGLIWFDTPVAINKEQSESLRDLVHELQPECLVSGRVGHDVGDYGSLGDNEHPAGTVEGAWETPATLNDTWGFKADDDRWKSLEYLLELLVNCASKGVNYLLNVGPTAEGVIPKPSADLLRQLGAWLDRNGEAIYGSVAGPFPTDPDWGRVTRKGDTIYLLIKKWQTGELKLPGLKNDIRAARVLGCPEASVETKREGDFVVVTLPGDAPEELFSVVALELEGDADVEQLVIQDGDSPIALPLHLAEMSGGASAMSDGSSQGWHDAKSAAVWTFRVQTPGDYEVAAITRANRKRAEAFGNHDLQLSIGDASVNATVGVKDLDTSDDAKVWQLPRSPMGTIRIDKAGETTLRAVATKIDPDSKRGLKLVAIELTPVK